MYKVNDCIIHAARKLALKRPPEIRVIFNTPSVYYQCGIRGSLATIIDDIDKVLLKKSIKLHV